MKVRLTAIIAFAFFAALTACQKDPVDVQDNITVGGDDFAPTENTVLKTDDGLKLTLADNDNSIYITTNDTVTGVYYVDGAASLKAATEKELVAKILFLNGGAEYYGSKGTIDIVISSTGAVDISFDATVTDADGNTVDIDGDDFKIASADVINNASGGNAVNDSTPNDTIGDNKSPIDTGSVVNADPITLNRWKKSEIWIDYCDTTTQEIKGYIYLTFNKANNVIYELELFGNTYGCSNDDYNMGKWYKEGEKYYFLEDGDPSAKSVITISADGSTLCLRNEGCLKKE